MTKPRPIKRCKLQHVALTTRGDRTNAVLMLTGDDASLAAAQCALEARKQKYPAYMERDPAHDALKIVMALTSEAQAIDAVEAVYDSTGCRLGGVHFQASADPLFPGNPKTPYAATVLVEPKENTSDSANIVGQCAMEVIRRKQQGGCICDPRSEPGKLRILKIDAQYDTESDALHHAEVMIRDNEKKFGIFHAHPSGLRLTGLHGDIHEDRPGRKRRAIHAAYATLRGSDADLDHAARMLRHRYRGRIVDHARGDGFMELAMGDTKPVDPANLLAATHIATGCELPVDISPATTRGKHPPYYHHPCLDAVVLPEVPEKHRKTTGAALACYADSFVPGDDHDVDNAGRVVLRQPFDREEDARNTAAAVAERVASRLKQGNGQQRER